MHRTALAFLATATLALGPTAGLAHAAGHEQPPPQHAKGAHHGPPVALVSGLAGTPQPRSTAVTGL